MGSKLEFIEFICEQLGSMNSISYKKMFGEYMIYHNGKPIILICNDTAYIKILPETTAIVGESNFKGEPYKGAKLHYILDVDNQEQMLEVAKVLETIIPLPKKKKK